MSAGNTRNTAGRPTRAGWLAVWVVLVGAASGRAAPPPPGDVVPAGGSGATGSGVVPAVGLGQPGTGVVPISGCASCGMPGGMPSGPGIYGFGKHPEDGCALGGCGSEGCGEAGCVAGRPPCATCEGEHRIGRLLCAYHNAICCPDPCYEPRWQCGPNAALFVDYARPVTLTRFRWDSGQNLTQPDRAEYFWAAIGRKGPGRPETSVDYNELRMYQEAGSDRFSFYIDVPYRNLEGNVNGGAGGFGDLIIGTKSLLIDSELVQTTFQLATSIPTGVPGRGIGVGHVSMDPSLLCAMKLYPDTYWQSQLGYWIPISGTTVNGSNFAGGVLHYHNSVNHVLCRPVPGTALVGSIESVGYTFTSGLFTGADGVVRSANEQTYFGVGPGFRLCVCDKLDIGFGMQFAVTSNHFADQLYRTEIRWRY